MSNSQRIPYDKSYAQPVGYNEPNNEMLATCTQYPNLNSRDYSVKKVNRSEPIMYPYYNDLEVNEFGHPMVTCCDFHGREWAGSLWCFKNFSDFGEKNKAMFHQKLSDNITCAKFLPNKLLMVGLSNGVVQLWETNDNINIPNKYILFDMKTIAHHDTMVTAMEVAKKDSARLITSSYDGQIILWKVEGTDFYYEHVYRRAHCYAINAVSSNPDCPNTFVSCSDDKSCLLWDVRDAKPARSVYEDHIVAFTAGQWCKTNDLYVGDDSGNVYFFDLRKTNQYVNVNRAFTDRIHKLRQFGDKLSVIANDNYFKIFDLNVAGDMSNVFFESKDKKSDDYIRDVHIVETDQEYLIYSVGWSSHFGEYTVKKT